MSPFSPIRETSNVVEGEEGSGLGPRAIREHWVQPVAEVHHMHQHTAERLVMIRRKLVAAISLSLWTGRGKVLWSPEIIGV